MGRLDKDKTEPSQSRLGKVVGDIGELELSSMQETAWAEVIGKMEEVYSDLIRYDVDLERKNTELEETHQFIDSVISSMSEILIVCDRNQYVEQVNKATEDLTGFSAQELVGRKFSDLVVAPDNSLFTNLCACGSGKTANYCEIRLKSKHDDAGSDPVSMNGSQRIDHQGRPVGIVIIGRPMGELRRAYQALNKAHDDLVRTQQRLLQSEKLASLGRLVAGVAHELNNPISFINGNIHSLEKYKSRLQSFFEQLDQGQDPQRLRRELKIDGILDDMDPLVDGTLEGAARVRDIVKNLRRLSFSGREMTEAFDLVQVVKTGVSWVRRSSPKPIEVHVDVPDRLEVIGHAGRIHQVVVNLVGNALDAVSETENPDVRVDLHSEGGRAVLRVSDNGHGISEENMAKIFDPFFTTKGVGEGTGLGLWISYDLVRDHDGDLRVESTPGEGTAFTMELPLAT